MRIKLLAAVAALAFSSSAYATTIGFDDMANPNSYLLAGGYASDGYRFVADRVSDEYFLFFGEEVRRFGYSIDPVGTTLANNFRNSAFTVSRDDGATFDLASFQFADVFNEGVFINDVSLILNYANGTSTRTLYRTDATPGAQTLTLGANGLTSFRIEVPEFNQFDNFVLNSAATAVPEPASWAMMILGLGAVGAALRRRPAVRVRFA